MDERGRLREALRQSEALARGLARVAALEADDA